MRTQTEADSPSKRPRVMMPMEGAALRGTPMEAGMVKLTVARAE